MKTKLKTAAVFFLVFSLLSVDGGRCFARVRQPSADSGRGGAFVIPVPSASGSAAKNNKKAVIDYSNAKDGYFMVKFAQKTSKELRVTVKGPRGDSYTYFLWPGRFEVFPFSEGSGSYTITVYEQVQGTKYSAANSAKVKVNLSSEYAPFLRPNQYVNYDKDAQTVKMAASLSGGSDGSIDKISEIYNYVISNISYDKELARTVKSGYLPDVDAVIGRKKGICFDYSAVMAAMLRSQGIPCKLVVGYAGAAYHAWINAYSAETGTVNSVITFDGKTWKLMDPTFASSGNQSGDIMKYIGNGSNYKPKYTY